jgi:hypothetical protein
MENIATVLIAVLGSGGLCSIITAIFSRRKYKAEASLIEVEAEEKRKTAEREYMNYIHGQFKEITETYKRESEELRTMNSELNDRVRSLENRINKLMEWIINDDGSYRTWLENELRKYDPDIEFPKCKPTHSFDSDADS